MLAIILLTLVQRILSSSLYTSWNVWSPCTRSCGSSLRYRGRFCAHHSCLSEIYINETESCLRICSTDTDANRGDCVVSENLRTLYDYGATKNPGFPSLYSHDEFCAVWGDGNDRIVKSGSIPYTLHHIYFNLTTPFAAVISIRYRIEDVNDWFSYPSNDDEMDLVIVATPNSPALFQFSQPFGGIEFKVVIKALSSGSNYCYQLDVKGCHLPLPTEIYFDTATSSTPITIDSDSRVNIFETYKCFANSPPFYYEKLQVRNLLSSWIIESDQSDVMYVSVITMNENNVYAENAITLHINFTSIDDLVGNFQCVENDGVVSCFNAFDCYGNVMIYNDKPYGDFLFGHLEVTYTFDVDMCWNSDCSVLADCIIVNDSFYCACREPYFGDGYSCASVSTSWLYHTEDLMEANVTDGSDYNCLFIANASNVVYACGRYDESRPYGCLISADGMVWKLTHPQLDMIFGEDEVNKNVYGYSSKDSAYLLYDPTLRMWMAIHPTMFHAAKVLPQFKSGKIILERGHNVDTQRNELQFPLRWGQSVFGSLNISVTTFGVTLKEDGEWKTALSWNDLPMSYS